MCFVSCYDVIITVIIIRGWVVGAICMDLVFVCIGISCLTPFTHVTGGVVEVRWQIEWMGLNSPVHGGGCMERGWVGRSYFLLTAGFQLQTELWNILPCFALFDGLFLNKYDSRKLGDGYVVCAASQQYKAPLLSLSVTLRLIWSHYILSTKNYTQTAYVDPKITPHGAQLQWRRVIAAGTSDR